MVFLNYKLSNILKEKGFKEPCYAHYYYEEFNYNEAYCGRMSIKTLSFVHNNDDAYDGYTDAPTIGQVIKWLRNEKNIIIAINPLIACNHRISGNNYGFHIFTKINRKLDLPETINIHYPTYEECEIASIEYVINNLI